MRVSVAAPDPLVTSATQAFSVSAGVATSVIPMPRGTGYDSTVEFELDPPVRRMAVVVPSIDRQERLSALAATTGLNDAQHVLLVTSYLSPALINTCRSLGVNAIDEAGNAFVKDGNTLVLISGRPRTTELRRPSLWSKRSLQVILALLVRPALLHESRRTIAMFAGVSTGTAHTTVQTLLQRKDLIERGDGLAFTNFDRLLDEWVTLYPSLLRESLKLGRYRATEPNWWTDMLAPNEEWMLGGESAAALITNYLEAGDRDGVLHQRDSHSNDQSRAAAAGPYGKCRVSQGALRVEPHPGVGRQRRLSRARVRRSRCERRLAQHRNRADDS